ncbi:MAG: PAS domain-containing protein, partial [Anaerolineales bacterium]|nr:PAS domain-containing protein [Anaerolineales bacterium]
MWQENVPNDPLGRIGNTGLAQTDFIYTVANSMSEGLCVLDDQGCIVFANTASREIIGWPEQELLGKNFYQILHLPDNHHQYHIAQEHPLHQVIRMGIALRNEDAAVLTRDGEMRYITYTATMSNVDNRGKHTV